SNTIFSAIREGDWLFSLYTTVRRYWAFILCINVFFGGGGGGGGSCFGHIHQFYVDVQLYPNYLFQKQIALLCPVMEIYVSENWVGLFGSRMLLIGAGKMGKLDARRPLSEMFTDTQTVSSNGARCHVNYRPTKLPFDDENFYWDL
ncbi:hypothetical protein ACJX0J_009081, partial [Zea mays]